MNELNVFKLCEGENFFRKIQFFFRGLKYMYQRGVHGYCDMDTWDLDWYYLRLLHGTLDRFAEKVSAYPDQIYDSFEDYQNDIKEQVKKLEYVMGDPTEENEYWEAYGQILTDTQKTESTIGGTRVWWEMNPEQEEIQAKFRERYDETIENHAKVRSEVFEWLKTHLNELWW